MLLRLCGNDVYYGYNPPSCEKGICELGFGNIIIMTIIAISYFIYSFGKMLYNKWASAKIVYNQASWVYNYTDVT